MNMHLDGLYEFAKMIESYGYEDAERHAALDTGGMKIEYTPKKGMWFKAEVWCRITVFVQSLLLLIVNTIKQGTRGSLFLLSSLYRFNLADLKFACIDFLSLLIQGIALPLFGLGAMISPGKAASLAKRCALQFNPDVFRTTNKWVVNQYAEVRTDESCRVYFLLNVLGKLTAPIQLIANLIQNICCKFFTMESFNDAWEIVKAPALFASHSFKCFFSKEYQEAHGFVER